MADIPNPDTFSFKSDLVILKMKPLNATAQSPKRYLKKHELIGKLHKFIFLYLAISLINPIQ